MMRLIVGSILASIFAPIQAQEVGSAAAAQMLADMQGRAIQSQMAWQSSKKITYLSFVPQQAPEQGDHFEGVQEGWEGDLSYWQFKVLNIINDKEVLLVNGKRTICLVGYPTEGLVSDQAVRIVGPARAGATKTYTTATGSTRTVRTFVLVKGESLDRFERDLKEKQLDREKLLVATEVAIVVQSMIWGKQSPEEPSKMDKTRQKRYKAEIELAGRLVKAAKIDGNLKTPMAFDPKKKRVEFDSEMSRSVAQDHLKSLIDRIPK